MKRLIAPLLALCGLFSCSTDETLPNIETTPPSGLFVAVNDIEVLAVDLRAGQCHQFTIWQTDGSRFFIQDFATSGQWPKYTYTYAGQSNGQMEMSATFLNDTAFVADFNAQITMQDLGMNVSLQTMMFAMEAKGAKFTRHDTPLDVNGDGVPDVLQ